MAERIRVLMIIARLNVGGPAIQAITLTRHLDPARFESVLAAGQCSPGEVEMLDLLRETGIEPVRIPGLGRALRPGDDARAFFHLARLIRRFRPHIVHTHTAKAGALGRLVATLTRVPVRIHTIHGHVFRGYFSSIGSLAAVLAERVLARLTHRVIAISESQVEELSRVYRVAPRQKLALVPLGLNLDPFLAVSRGEVAGTLRSEIGASPHDVLVGIVGRIAPIKNHPLFVTAFAQAASRVSELRAVVIGDGTPTDVAALTTQARALGVASRLHFLGYRDRLAELYADLDMVALSSNNEGTPVALIEALACGLPCVATRVGGVKDVLENGRLGSLVPPGDAAAFAHALADLARNPDRRATCRAGAVAVATRYGLGRFIRDVERLYTEVALQKS